MSYHVIFKDGHFIGYTTDKKLLGNFLNNRKGKFRVEKFKADEIPDSIRKSFDFTNYELTQYTDYYTSNDTVLFNYEQVDMEEYMLQDMLALQHLIIKLLGCLRHVKFSDDESRLIRCSLHRLFDDIRAITDTNEAIFDEIINIRKYFYDRYLPCNRTPKDIDENPFIITG